MVTRRRWRPAVARQDLVALAVIGLLVSGCGGMGVLYLTAFARLTAQGARLVDLDSRAGAVGSSNVVLLGEVTKLTRRDRVEREGPRLGLVALPPADTHRLRLSAAPVAAPTRPVSHTTRFERAVAD
jgi:hypothetical protein